MSDYNLKAKEYADRCFSGKRWGGNPLLIVIDTALTSTGLKYFTVIVPRVKIFQEQFSDLSLQEFSKFSSDDSRLLKLFNNPRAWKVAIEICKLFNGKKDLKEWAQKTNYRKWKQDPVGKIPGVGLNTFQYLRMQIGVDTTMPDRIIWRSVEKQTGKKIPDMISLIRECEQLSKKMRISQVELCWRIWLSESDKE